MNNKLIKNWELSLNAYLLDCTKKDEKLRNAIMLRDKKVRQETADEIFNWSEEWFDSKRKDNTMWKLNQDELKI